MIDSTYGETRNLWDVEMHRKIARSLDHFGIIQMQSGAGKRRSAFALPQSGSWWRIRDSFHGEADPRLAKISDGLD